MKLKIYVTRIVPQEGIDIIKDKYDVDVWDSEDVIPYEALREKVVGITALFCTISDNIDAGILDAAGPSLKVVATMSVGQHHIDLEECKRRGIQVTNTPDVASDSAAELTVALLLLTTRRLLEGFEAVKNGEWGKWKPMWILGTESLNRTLGIMGMGRVGFGVARRLKPFGVSRIIYYDVTQAAFADDVGAELVSFEELLKESDLLCVCCALTPQTRHIFDKSAFSKMKSSAVLINTSRAALLQQSDLYDALKEGQISAAGLDVTDPEPLPINHPLLSLPNCVILPHLGTNTTDARSNMSINTAMNIRAVLEPLE
ncbi:glyoxylate reductase/hydroxypyruvate reductase [Patella vulgata]|uniref:glyoxylate reductase/hydroxypyruvate reductase n=1 Tax=Patella vulgata TaxID=6465 RepID=UPI00217F5729|nr:glyoxylate reductase/hydroxypyruvate reductase [Patella vulgata]